MGPGNISKKGIRKKGWGIISAIGVLLIVMLITLNPGPGSELIPPEEPQGTSGVFRFSAYGAGETRNDPLRHTTVYVRGPSFNEFEDNDLRGFLDGRFKNGWNQPGQTHVRVGRREMSKLRSIQQSFIKHINRVPGVDFIVSKFEPEYPFLGEQELFRVLFRLDKFDLPPNANIVNTKFRLNIEKGPGYKMRLYLYEVKKDWFPGSGGRGKNNISPPEIGEVWWKDVGFGEEEWGLPGAGFSADGHPEADVDPQPLAWTEYNPGDHMVEFSSGDLSEYISIRIQERKPVLLLLKLSDVREDTPGSRISLFSSEHGDDRNVIRRPHLILEWESKSEAYQLEKPIKLEYGRWFYFPRMDVSGMRHYTASFISDNRYTQPTIQFRGGEGKTESLWREATLPFSGNWDWLEFRVFSGNDPINYGESFEATLKDTWIVTDPPSDQKVEWRFVSPAGMIHSIESQYLGEYEWEVRFRPNEIGRWRYSWTQQFTRIPYKSAEGYFDVYIEDRETAKNFLGFLKDQIIKDNYHTRQERVAAFGVPFMKIQRAILKNETPESFRNASGKELRGQLDDIRGLIWGKPVPEELPLREYAREW